MSSEIDVYYDGQCPICVWEVDLYTRMDKRSQINWTDINALGDTQLPIGKTREDLLGKFHVRETNANTDEPWYIGVDAFGRIWRSLPGLRHAAFIFRLPIIRQIAGAGYIAFLRWQRWHRTHRR